MPNRNQNIWSISPSSVNKIFNGDVRPPLPPPNPPIVRHITFSPLQHSSLTCVKILCQHHEDISVNREDKYKALESYKGAETRFARPPRAPPKPCTTLPNSQLQLVLLYYILEWWCCSLVVHVGVEVWVSFYSSSKVVLKLVRALHASRSAA